MLTTLILAATIAAPDPWLDIDKGLEASFAALVVTDVLQTRYFTTGGRCCEGNPLLPALPSRGQMYAIAIGVPAAHALVAHYLPSGGLRTAWQLAFIAAELLVVRDNYLRYGLSLRF